MKSFTFILFSLLLVDGCLLAFAEGRQRRPEGDAPGLPIAVQPAERKASKPQSVPSKASKVLTLEEFKDEKFKAPTEKTTVSVQIHPSLSNYVLRLIPAPVDDPDRGRQPVGRIEIFKHPSGPVFQAINVSAEASTDFFKRCTEFVDINHDGEI